MGQRIVVIGNGMVGHRFWESWSADPRSSGWQAVCLGEEPRPAYDRIHLTEYFTHRDASQLALADAQWYADRGISLVLGDPVVRLDRSSRIVFTRSGRAESYDVLVFATGSAAFMPPVPGIGLAGVYPYRTIEDLDAILAGAEGKTKGTVIGGGLLGLESAKALKDLGLAVSVIDHSETLMHRQLDHEGGATLRTKIEALGIEVITGKKTTSIEGEGKVDHLCFHDGTCEEAQVVIVSAGIRPRDEVAKAAGLVLGDRGGILVDAHLRTNDPAVYAVGECALAAGMVYGLAAPGYRMAEAAAAHILTADADRPGLSGFAGADLSTKLKLLGVDVASVGDSLVADGEKIRSVVFSDRQNGIYKKLSFDVTKNVLKGAVLVGDAEDYGTLLQLYLNKIPLPAQPGALLFKGGGGFTIGVDSLPDEAVICSCNNVTKGLIAQNVRDGVHKLEALKTCTRAGTGCGSCSTMVKEVLHAELGKLGVEIDKSLCEHFQYTRTELYEIVKIQGIRTFAKLIATHGTGKGCEICKPVAASIFASLGNGHVMDHKNLQDTNDAFMANIQKNGTYSVVPRVPGGEITPDQLIAIGAVAKEFDLYTKITGGQRIDLFGARVEDLPAIWQRLIDAGMESGHAYAKALRTVKSCVGSTWCRFGVQDSTTLAIDLEQRYRGLRAPHKIKFAVSGCARECAEAQGKDVGVIATTKGWNLYVCGNGGMTPRHAVLLATDVDRETLIRYIDRFLIYYIRTADRLTRTAPWLEKLPGGIDHVKDVVCRDKLGLGAEMEAEMAKLVAGYEDEWAVTLGDPVKLARFRPFANSDARDESIAFVRVRGQIQPVPILEPTGVTP
jgi:nitrite reductase (NADH) large subunit